MSYWKREGLQNPQEGDLKVWWIPQLPMKSFDVPVSTPQEGALLLDVLANYDLFQFDNNVKGDYANAGGLQVFERGEWLDWYDDEGGSVDDLIEELRSAAEEPSPTT